MVFGRKGLADRSGSPPPISRSEHPGHRAVLAHLRGAELKDPLIRPRMTGKLTFDLAYQIVAGERGARIEDLLAVLASAGGFSCIVAVLDTLRRQGRTPRDAGVLEVGVVDGNRYYFGDMPNRLLWESQHSLLSLVLGAAQDAGGEISAAMVEEAIRRTASTIGKEDFGRVHVPEAHRPAGLPVNYVRYLWPKLREGLDLYEVPPEQRPMALGVSLQIAITQAKDVLDPTIAAQICIDCAVPAAKLDPAAFA